jgi:hypothetical protein
MGWELTTDITDPADAAGEAQLKRSPTFNRAALLSSLDRVGCWVLGIDVDVIRWKLLSPLNTLDKPTSLLKSSLTTAILLPRRIESLMQLRAEFFGRSRTGRGRG